MDQIPAFFIAIAVASLVKPRLGPFLSPFLSLVLSSIIYGQLCGMVSEVMTFVTAGLSRIFSSLAIVVFRGAIIAEYLRKTGAIALIV